MLPRALHELYENIRDFFVIEEENNIVGTAAVHVNWANLAEVKSVAVSEQCQRKGYGRLLIRACIVDACEIGVSTLFCLTYRPEFFSSLGFQVIERSALPRKVWSECVRCPKFTDCTEIAMSIQILEDSATTPPDPLISLASLPHHYDE